MVTVASRTPKVGDKVTIMWGLDEITGRVQAIYHSGLGTRYRVEVPVLGPSDDALDYTTVTVPEDAVLSVLRRGRK